jgi:hypothetical protein
MHCRRYSRHKLDGASTVNWLGEGTKRLTGHRLMSEEPTGRRPTDARSCPGLASYPGRSAVQQALWWQATETDATRLTDVLIPQKVLDLLNRG